MSTLYIYFAANISLINFEYCSYLTLIFINLWDTFIIIILVYVLFKYFVKNVSTLKRILFLIFFFNSNEMTYCILTANRKKKKEQ